MVRVTEGSMVFCSGKKHVHRPKEPSNKITRAVVHSICVVIIIVDNVVCDVSNETGSNLMDIKQQAQ